MDLEHIDNADLSNIQANAQIGYAVPDDINRLLAHVCILREAYHNVIQKEQRYSRGRQYARAAAIISEVDFHEFDEILFCNFFYFNRCEEMIVTDLLKRGKANLIFQGDQRKWPVLQRIAKKFDCVLEEGAQVDKTKFDLHLYSAFDVHAQVSHVREILKTIKHPEKTVIVLPNPDNIIPLISEIAHYVKDFNVSMGYPLKRSSLYALFTLMFKAQGSRKDDRYYARDYLNVMRHPFVKNLFLKGNTTSVTKALVYKIEEILTGKELAGISGSLFVSLEEIEQTEEVYALNPAVLDNQAEHVSVEEMKEILKRVHQGVFKTWEDISNFRSFAGFLSECLDLLMAHSPLEQYPLNINIAQKMLQAKRFSTSATTLGASTPRTCSSGPTPTTSPTW